MRTVPSAYLTYSISIQGLEGRRPLAIGIARRGSSTSRHGPAGITIRHEPILFMAGLKGPPLFRSTTDTKDSVFEVDPDDDQRIAIRHQNGRTNRPDALIAACLASCLLTVRRQRHQRFVASAPARARRAMLRRARSPGKSPMPTRKAVDARVKRRGGANDEAPNGT